VTGAVLCIVYTVVMALLIAHLLLQNKPVSRSFGALSADQTTSIRGHILMPWAEADDERTPKVKAGAGRGNRRLTWPRTSQVSLVIVRPRPGAGPESESACGL
jgi:hypothetical protein